MIHSGTKIIECHQRNRRILDSIISQLRTDAKAHNKLDSRSMGNCQRELGLIFCKNSSVPAMITASRKLIKDRAMILLKALCSNIDPISPNVCL